MPRSGLGEALVSGQVEPDHYVVNVLDNQIVSKKLGAKKISTRGKAGGGVETIEESAEARQALSDEDILNVAAIGQQIQKEYNFPQDIEWALADGKLYILQSRAITSLYPLPKESFDPLIVWFSLGAFQGMLGAMTPLGQDTLRMFFSIAAKLFGAQIRYDETDGLLPAGERLWIKISDIMRNPLGRRVYRSILGFGEPSVGQILRGLEDEPHLGTAEGHLKFSSYVLYSASSFRFYPGRPAPSMILIKPVPTFDAYIESQLIRPNITGDDKFTRLAQRLQYLQENAAAGLFQMFPHFVPVLGPTMLSLALLTRVTRKDHQAETDHGFSTVVLEVTRGLPNNVTTEMDLALWKTANNIRADSDSLKTFLDSDAQTLASHYLSGTLPETAQKSVANFMANTGCVGLAKLTSANHAGGRTHCHYADFAKLPANPARQGSGCFVRTRGEGGGSRQSRIGISRAPSAWWLVERTNCTGYRQAHSCC